MEAPAQTKPTKYLFFDTEYNSANSSSCGFDFSILILSQYTLMEMDGKLISTYCLDLHWPIHANAYSGISCLRGQMYKHVTPVESMHTKEALDKLIDYIQQLQENYNVVLITHWAVSDRSILYHELKRYGIDFNVSSVKWLCTCFTGKKYLRSTKNPKLSELYDGVFGRGEHFKRHAGSKGKDSTEDCEDLRDIWLKVKDEDKWKNAITYTVDLK